MRMRIAAIAAGAAIVALPASAQADHQDLGEVARSGDWKSYEKRYLRVHDRYAHEFGVREAGRNIVVDGFNPKGGKARTARRPEIVRSIERMLRSLNPPEPVVAEAPQTTGTTAPETGATAPVTGTTAPVTGAPTSVIECESGGDYQAVNPAGYYGAYQFDQQTWDAHAPEGYAGTNPAAAPPSVQDQAAANVPYDAWPNC